MLGGRWYALVLLLLGACNAATPPLIATRDASPDRATAVDVVTPDASPPPDVAPDVAAPDVATPDVTPPADVAPVDAAPPGPRPGLAFLGEADLTGQAHSREIARDGDIVYLADANGLPIARTMPGGGLSLVHPLVMPREQHCSTVSVHARSHTLVCAAADSGLVDFIDVRDPARPASNLWSANEHDARGNPPIYEIADVEVSGDTLWMAAHRNGLLRVDLGADGRPTALRRTGRGENVTNVLARDGRLLLTDRAQGLVALAEADLAPVATQALDGPPLDLDAQGERVAVALGSEGARVYRLAGGAFTEVASVQPRCVTTGVALSGDLLAVTCLTGVTLYDLARSPARVAGFFPARFGMLDVAFGPHGLLVTDWYRLDQFATSADGAVLLADAPATLRLRPGADARVAVRNPTAEPLTFAWRLGNTGGGPPTREGTLDLPASGDAALALPATALEAAGSRDNAADLLFYRPGAPTADLAAAPRTRVWHRGATDSPARGLVAIGDRFPTLRRTNMATAPATLPAAGAETLVMFLTVDCYLQWPQLEDMAWNAAHIRMQPAPLVFFLTTMDEDPFDPGQFMRSHAAGDLPTYEWADYARSVAGQEAEPNPVRAFEMSYFIHTPGADYPHDYRVGVDGATLDTLRMYRGRWHLRAP
ncbi:MAG: hypothetical protein U0324_04830 [Polyangiales bacterium]